MIEKFALVNKLWSSGHGSEAALSAFSGSGVRQRSGQRPPQTVESLSGAIPKRTESLYFKPLEANEGEVGSPPIKASPF